MDPQTVLLAAATVAGAMVRDHNAPAAEIARRSWDVTAALITEGQVRGYPGISGQLGELTQAAQQGFAGTQPETPGQGMIGGVPNETPRRQQAGSAGSAR